jgi:hypothetical protein
MSRCVLAALLSALVLSPILAQTGLKKAAARQHAVLIALDEYDDPDIGSLK